MPQGREDSFATYGRYCCVGVPPSQHEVLQAAAIRKPFRSAGGLGLWQHMQHSSLVVPSAEALSRGSRQVKPRRKSIAGIAFRGDGPRNISASCGSSSSLAGKVCC